MEIRELPSGVEGVTLLALDGGLDHTTTALFVGKMDDLLQKGSARVVGPAQTDMPPVGV